MTKLRRAIRLRGATPDQLAYYLGRLALLPLVRWRRRRWRGTAVVGVTGSAGKSTTVRLLEGALAPLGPVLASERSRNTAKSVAQLGWRLRGRHRVVVQELAAWAPGTMAELAWTLQPDVGVVTAVGWDHYRNFRGPDGVAREKAELVRALPASGLAVLNADDPRVLAMAAGTAARVVTFGAGEAAGYRARDVSADWPDRLEFDLEWGTRRTHVSTRLIGGHWVSAVLAALATALELGVPVEAAVAAAGAVEPLRGRFSESDGGGGVTFLEDNFKAPVWTVWPALDVLGAARAARRVAVIGQLSDDPRKPRELYRDVVSYALGRADLVVVHGRWAAGVGRRFAADPRVRACEHLREVHELLSQELRAGDLVLLKGSIAADHSERLALARAGAVRCWRTACGRSRPCHECDQRLRPREP